MGVCFAVSRHSRKGICYNPFESVFALDAFQRESHRSALVSEMTAGADILRCWFTRNWRSERYPLPDQTGIAVAPRSIASHEVLMYSMRIVAGEFSRQNILAFRARELGINIFRCQAYRNPIVANAADRRTISAIELLLVTTKARIMIRIPHYRARLSRGSDFIWCCG